MYLSKQSSYINIIIIINTLLVMIVKSKRVLTGTGETASACWSSEST